MSDLAILTFGEFELAVRRRTLARAGHRLRLGSRAMDILLLLAERAGELVTKEAILDRLWPGLFVEETSLRVHMSSLRKTLGGDHIHTVAGRGYMLVTPVTRSAEPERSGAAPESRLDLPLRLERLIGRGAVVEAIAGQILESRFVTIVGPGGIGKTSVALEVAERLAGEFADGVRFVDLASLDDPETAPGALAIALGLPALSELTPAALARFLAGKRLLVVLDNCERLADAAASVAEALLRSTSSLCVLATSREALRAEAEWVHRLPPLSTPASIPASPAAALKFSAIELFVDRAAAASGGYRLEAEDCACVTDICRRLDGLPLAIELAAKTVGALGVRGVAAGLDDRLALLTGGKRTAESRHQTLRAALDWSYDLLSQPERAALDRLSVLAGAFDLDLACAVASDAQLPSGEVSALVGALVRKSLVAVESGGEVRYRLLESTRVYASDKLERSGEAQQAMDRYAKATLHFFQGAHAQWASLGGDVWLARHFRRLEDARAVLEWAFSEAGDRTLARSLTAEVSAIWLHVGLMRECLAWCRKAMDAAPDDVAHADAAEMKIQHAYGVAHGFTFGNNMGNRTHVEATIKIARRLGDHDYAIRGLWALATLELNEGALEDVLVHAAQLRDMAGGADSEAEQLVGERMMGSALHLLGRHAEARAILEANLAAYALPGRRASATRFQYDQVVLTRGFLAWIDWIEGNDEGSRGHAEAGVIEAVRIDHAGSLGFALDTAVTLAIFRGDLEAAEKAVEQLREMGSNVGFEVWMARSEILRAIIQVRSGDLAAGLPRLQASLAKPIWKMMTYRTPVFLAQLAEAEAAAGLPEKALATIDEAIGWFGGADAFWCGPECLRVKAEILAQSGGANAMREAQALFERAANLAAQHGAPAWTRRIEASLQQPAILEAAAGQG
jgi:predicted ATPase/DNA-binding winged helix-turn-helix (wHTH) protein